MSAPVPAPDVRVHVFPEQLTLREVMVERDRLVAALQQGVTRADLSALQHFDSGALVVMLAGVRASRRAGKPFAFEGVPDKLRGLARLYGLQELLPDAFA
jgi:phospholipid transport system transporter-binding protein